MRTRNYHSYTHLILALGIVREPTVWGFITSKYPGVHDIGRADTLSPRSTTAAASRQSATTSSGGRQAAAAAQAEAGERAARPTRFPLSCAPSSPSGCSLGS